MTLQSSLRRTGKKARLPWNRRMAVFCTKRRSIIDSPRQRFIYNRRSTAQRVAIAGFGEAGNDLFISAI
jgi:hypothetical protein